MMRTPALAVAVALPVVLVGVAPAIAQDAPVTIVDPRSEMDWTPWISDVPNVDLSGTWVFDPEQSDPLLEDWQGSSVEYEIFQQPDRIVLRFKVGGEPVTVDSFAWTGRVEESRQDGMAIRKRARWTEGGRVFLIEGRWWNTGDDPTPRQFSYRYTLRNAALLVFTQSDEFGTTTWRFRRR